MSRKKEQPPVQMFTAVPRKFRTERRMRTRTRVLIGVIIFSWILALLVGFSGAAPEVEPPGIQYRSEATAAVYAWLAGEPVQLATTTAAADFGRLPARLQDDDDREISVVEPIPFDFVSWQDATVTATGTTPFETHRFLVGLDSGRVLDVTVVIMVTPTGPVLAQAPTVQAPRLADTPSADGLGWGSALGAANPSNAVIEQIQAWAQAWAQADTRELYALTRDTEPRLYRGLGGFTPTNVAVLAAGTNEEGKIVARVRITMFDDSIPSVIVNTDFDVLVGRVTEPLPSIEAWGPPGSGPTLVAFQNGEAPLGENATTATTRPLTGSVAPTTTTTIRVAPTTTTTAPPEPTTTTVAPSTTTVPPTPAAGGDGEAADTDEIVPEAGL